MRPTKRPWDASPRPSSSRAAGAMEAAPGLNRSVLNRKLKASIEAVNKKRMQTEANPTTPTTPRFQPLPGGTATSTRMDDTLSPRETTVLRELSSLLAAAAATGPTPQSQSQGANNTKQQKQRHRGGITVRQDDEAGGAVAPSPKPHHHDRGGGKRGGNDVEFAGNSVGALRAVLDEARVLVREKDAQLEKAASRISSLETELMRAKDALGREGERALRAERRAAALERAMGIVDGDIAPGVESGAGTGTVAGADPHDPLGGGGGDGDGGGDGGGGGDSDVDESCTNQVPSTLEGSPSFSFPPALEVAAKNTAVVAPPDKNEDDTDDTGDRVEKDKGDDDVASSPSEELASAPAALAHPVMEVEAALAVSLRASRRREREMLRHLEGAAADLAASERERDALRAAAEAESAGRKEAEREAATAKARVRVLEARLAESRVSQSHAPDVDRVTSSVIFFPCSDDVPGGGGGGGGDGIEGVSYGQMVRGGGSGGGGGGSASPGVESREKQSRRVPDDAPPPHPRPHPPAAAHPAVQWSAATGGERRMSGGYTESPRPPLAVGGGIVGVYPVVYAIRPGPAAAASRSHPHSSERERGGGGAAVTEDAPDSSGGPRAGGAPPPTPAAAREFLMQKLSEGSQPWLQPRLRQPDSPSLSTSQERERSGHLRWQTSPRGGWEREHMLTAAHHEQRQMSGVHDPRTSTRRRQQQSAGGQLSPSPSPSPGLVSLLNMDR